MSNISTTLNKSIEEPLCCDGGRHSVIPLNPKYSRIWKCFQSQLLSFWTHNKIHFDEDAKYYQKLPSNVKNMYDHVLAFFAIGDELVSENLNENFIREIKNPEAVQMLVYQAMMENQHSIVYNNNIMSVYPFEQDRQRIFNLVKTSPVVKLKESFMRKWMNPKLSLGHRIVAYMGAEGIGFSASFAFIDWGKIMGYKLEGMFHANDYISADESQHTIGGAAMEHYIANKISDEEVKKIFDEAIEIEVQFARSLIPADGLPNGMTRINMEKHIIHCANILTLMLGRKGIYGNTSTPFKYLSFRNLAKKVNFFEQENTNYIMDSKDSVPVTNDSFDTMSDF